MSEPISTNPISTNPGTKTPLAADGETTPMRVKAAPAKAERLGTIVGDRACTACGFNLIGQPIVREDHYGLIIARCPECGTVASLQEYPALGKWANRWAGFLAILWLILSLVVFAGGTGATFGLTVRSIEIASDNADDVLVDTYNEWARSIEDRELAQLPASHAVNGAASWDTPSEAWPMYDDPSAAFDARGGIASLIEPGVYWFWGLMCLIACPFGIYWGLTMLDRARWRVAVVPTIGAIIASALLVTFVRTQAGGSPSLREITLIEMSGVVGPISIGLMASVMIVLAFCARPIARWVVVTALPPRLRVPFGVLWTSAGRPPPSPRAGMQKR